MIRRKECGLALPGGRGGRRLERCRVSGASRRALPVPGEEGRAPQAGPPGGREGDRAEDEAGQACWGQLAKMLPWPARTVRNMHRAVSPLKAECCRKWNVGFEHRVDFAHV